MQKKIDELEAEKRELKEKLEIKEDLIYENNAHWIIRGNKKDGPYCSRCWDVEKNTVRIKQSVANPSFHSCPECKTQVQTNPGYSPPYRNMRPPIDYR